VLITVVFEMPTVPLKEAQTGGWHLMDDQTATASWPLAVHDDGTLSLQPCRAFHSGPGQDYVRVFDWCRKKYSQREFASS
jgi:hypothetical protein